MLFPLLSKYRSTCWLKNWLNYWFILSSYDSFLVVDPHEWFKPFFSSFNQSTWYFTDKSTTASRFGSSIGPYNFTHLDSSSILLSIQDMFYSLLQMSILFSLSAIIHVVFQLKIQVLFLFSNQDVASQHKLSSLEAEYWFKNASSSLLSFSSILPSAVKFQVLLQLLVHLHFSIRI